jgi:glycosyltransferase involved in cell wall biosynthesis
MINQSLEILIPSFRGEKYLPLCLTALAQSTFRDFVIRLGPEGPWGNRDFVQGLIDSLNLPVVINYSEEHIGLARNRIRLLKNSEASLVLWLDDDVLVSTNSIERLIANANELGTTFSILTGVGSNLAGHPTVTCGLGFTLCSRSVLIGDEALTHDFGFNTGEDCLWTARIVYKTGLPVRFVPSFLHHIGEGRRRKRYGVQWNDSLLLRYTSEEFYQANLDELRYSYPVYNYMDY